MPTTEHAVTPHDAAVTPATPTSSAPNAPANVAANMSSPVTGQDPADQHRPSTFTERDADGIEWEVHDASYFRVDDDPETTPATNEPLDAMVEIERPSINPTSADAPLLVSGSVRDLENSSERNVEDPKSALTRLKGATHEPSGTGTSSSGTKEGFGRGGPKTDAEIAEFRRVVGALGTAQAAEQFSVEQRTVNSWCQKLGIAPQERADPRHNATARNAARMLEAAKARGGEVGRVAKEVGTAMSALAPSASGVIVDPGGASGVIPSEIAMRFIDLADEPKIADIVKAMDELDYTRLGAVVILRELAIKLIAAILARQRLVSMDVVESTAVKIANLAMMGQRVDGEHPVARDDEETKNKYAREKFMEIAGVLTDEESKVMTDLLKKATKRIQDGTGRPRPPLYDPDGQEEGTP
jgi:hypothetical protein